MHRIDNSTASTTLPAIGAAGPNPNGYYTSGNPGGGQPATVLDQDAFNAVQEEICNVVTGAGLTLTKSTLTQLRTAINGLISTAVATGVATAEAFATSAVSSAISGVAGLKAGYVGFFAMTSAPTGYLECNGAAVSRSTYSALFGAVGTTFGVGDGSTTFNVPDLRGKFIRGYDDGAGVDTGRSFCSNQASQAGAHSHTAHIFNNRDGARTSESLTSWTGLTAVVGGGTDVVNSEDGGTPPWVGAATGSTGETRPTNVALLPCIKY